MNEDEKVEEFWNVLENEILKDNVGILMWNFSAQLGNEKKVLAV